jgi:hypothetical protein
MDTLLILLFILFHSLLNAVISKGEGAIKTWKQTVRPGLYCTLVPRHMPVITRFAVVGEVTFTTACKMSFDMFYAQPSNQGAYFAWPAGECVCICPGTGEVVAPDSKRVHLLVAANMYATRSKGSSLDMLTRIMPRILTIEGFNHMFREDEGKDTHYPSLVQQMCGRAKRTANKAWEEFHFTGKYLAYERFLLDESSKVNNFVEEKTSFKMSVGGNTSGVNGGPSAYMHDRHSTF